MAASLNEYQENCFLKNHHIWNIEEEKCIPLHCNKYACPLHGWKRKYKLAKGITKFLQNFKRIRLWTLTISSKDINDQTLHYHTLSLAFRYFTTFVRRHKALSETEKSFQYIKVVDLHKNGFIHYHAFFDRFISIYKLIPLWQKAVNLAYKKLRPESMRTDLKILIGCSIHAKSLFSAQKAANYIAKYVVKAAQKNHCRLNYYSKSTKISLFEKREKNGNWLHTYPGRQIDYYFRSETPLLVPKIDIVTYKNLEFFPINDEIDKFFKSRYG